MNTFNKNIQAYKKQLEKGDISAGYKCLMEFIADFKNQIKNENPTHTMSGQIHYGFMDITFFSFMPEVLKREKLKIVVIFNHAEFQFELWLCGQNKQIQQKYWELFRGSDWDKYNIPSKIDDRHSIVEHVLAKNPNFDDPTALRDQMSNDTTKFVEDIIKVFI